MKQKNQDSRRLVKITEKQAQEMVESGCEISKQIAYDTYPELKGPQLPKRWEDVELENVVYVDHNNRLQYTSNATSTPFNKNLLPNTNLAEAHRVVPELITMREVYREGWTPSSGDRGWSVIYDVTDGWVVGIAFNQIFNFPTKEVAQLFLNNFKPQLETYAKLYG
jgi:hypothetical protein